MPEKTISITFFIREQMPVELMNDALKQGLDCGPNDMVAVKTTLEGMSLTYKFEVVESTPKGIRDYMAKLALEDGTDLNEALRRAFLEASEI